MIWHRSVADAVRQLFANTVQCLARSRESGEGAVLVLCTVSLVKGHADNYRTEEKAPHMHHEPDTTPVYFVCSQLLPSNACALKVYAVMLSTLQTLVQQIQLSSR